MGYLDEVELPANQSPATRLAWAGERYSDLCRGAVSPDTGWFIWNVVVGWTDLCTEDERRQYLIEAAKISRFLREIASNRTQVG
jgi:hypothetical protein